jgi:uncharacterized damage-inducible protein DinB
MDAICTAAQAKFHQQEQGFLAVIHGLSDDAMNWRPGAETNSIAVLVAHTWGAAQAWTARAAGTEIERDRDAEFRVVLSAAEAETLIRRAGERVAMFLGAIDSATYGDDRVNQDGEHATVAMCLIHALEHTQEHYGHACLTRQLWEQRTAP